VKEIEEAVLRPSAAELAAFRAWFAEFDAEAWDRRTCEHAVARIGETLRQSAVL